MVEAGEAVLVEGVSERLMVALSVVLQIVQQISIPAELKDQIHRPWEITERPEVNYVTLYACYETVVLRCKYMRSMPVYLCLCMPRAG